LTAFMTLSQEKTLIYDLTKTPLKTLSQMYTKKLSGI